MYSRYTVLAIIFELMRLMEYNSTSLVNWLEIIKELYLWGKNLSRRWPLRIWNVFYGITGCMTKKYTQHSDKDFKCLCCYCFPPLPLRGLEPLLRVDVQKVAIGLCPTTTLTLCSSQIRVDGMCESWRLRSCFWKDLIVDQIREWKPRWKPNIYRARIQRHPFFLTRTPPFDTRTHLFDTRTPPPKLFQRPLWEHWFSTSH